MCEESDARVLGNHMTSVIGHNALAGRENVSRGTLTRLAPRTTHLENPNPVKKHSLIHSPPLITTRIRHRARVVRVVPLSVYDAELGVPREHLGAQGGEDLPVCGGELEGAVLAVGCGLRM